MDSFFIRMQGDGLEYVGVMPTTNAEVAIWEKVKAFGEKVDLWFYGVIGMPPPRIVKGAPFGIERRKAAYLKEWGVR